MKSPETELLRWMRLHPDERDEKRFESIALALFAHQFEHCTPYRRFCEGRDRTPETVQGWMEIPAVPTGAFKELRLASFPEERTKHVFRTSGTTTNQRGELHLESLEAYEASLVPSFERGVLPDLAGDVPVRMLLLAPSPEAAPDSSLSHMLGVMQRRRGDTESRFFVEDGELQTRALTDALETAAITAIPILLCGTAFAFVHLLDAMQATGQHVVLPANARIMETGGFKGRARAMDRSALYDWITDRLDVPDERIVNQYGMTELASQFYDTILSRPEEPRRKRIPPWVRVRMVDPESGTEVANGEVGVIRIVDLANTGSMLAIQTADLGAMRGDGFEVLGRAQGAEARGCSIAADEMLSAARS
ncbi:MAG: long-chain fatty acid--CoA ligase [bacterium]|nr:long-chain fatty acid--CoA ligase [bacterium]MCP5069613.1 long-chain fatty acid--CoA ligase [bacterium]